MKTENKEETVFQFVKNNKGVRFATKIIGWTLFTVVAYIIVNLLLVGSIVLFN